MRRAGVCAVVHGMVAVVGEFGSHHAGSDERCVREHAAPPADADLCADAAAGPRSHADQRQRGPQADPRPLKRNVFRKQNADDKCQQQLQEHDFFPPTHVLKIERAAQCGSFVI